MYTWRKLSPAQRTETLRHRKQRGFPHHSPPHFSTDAPNFYHLTGACYNHTPVIGKSPHRMQSFQGALLTALRSYTENVQAWCVLPNHWHALVMTLNIKVTVRAIGRLHGRTSYQWNKEDQTPGRSCWHGCSDRRIRSDAHFWATVNYIHHNPVHHGHAKNGNDWPHSSVRAWLEKVGDAEAQRIWSMYPILDYGKGWDDPDA